MAKGWTNPSTSVRRGLDYSVDVTGRGGPENPPVHSKAVRNYGRDGAGGSRGSVPGSTGRQPGELYRDPVNPDSPITHHGGPAVEHKETVGWLNGEFRRATTPNADARRGTDRLFTHEPLRPVGMTNSKTGGEHGSPQTRPAPRGNGGAAAQGVKGPGGALNARRDRNRLGGSSS